jgi:preprotein translocase subunit SecE
MADKDDHSAPTSATDVTGTLEVPETGGALVTEPTESVDTVVQEPAVLGASKYVHGAFLALGVLAAFLSSKILGVIWNQLAEWPAAVKMLPQLVSYPEEQRETFTLVAGALIGIVGILQLYRKESVRSFADEVARELGKVSWPSREAVINGTLVVIIASAMATVYVAILDRFLGFLTTLVYGA